MIVGVGTDVVELARLKGLSDRAAFLEEVLTASEIRRGPRGEPEEEHIAGLFAVKEALLKALGVGLEEGARWHEMEVREDGQVRLSGQLSDLARRRSVTAIHVSRATSAQKAIAIVVLESTI
jgi:holo-[acyl-carrier protein] synthase